MRGSLKIINIIYVPDVNTCICKLGNSDLLGQDLSSGWVWFVGFILSLAVSRCVTVDLSRYCRVISRWRWLGTEQLSRGETGCWLCHGNKTPGAAARPMSISG